MKICIVGGHGFIGRVLCGELLGRGHSVISVDLEAETRISTAPAIDGVTYVWRNNPTSPISGAATDPAIFADVEVVIYAAGPRPRAKIGPWPAAMFANFLVPAAEDMDNLIWNLPMTPGPKLIYLSSAHVYGKVVGTTPILETAPRNPVSTYGIVKAALEDYASVLSAKYGVNVLTLRLPNVYGPNLHGTPRGDVVETMLTAATTIHKTNRGDIDIYGAWDNVIDLIHVNDVAYIIAECLQQNVVGTYNVSGRHPVRVRDLALMIGRVAGLSDKILHMALEPKPARSADVMNTYLDDTKLQDTVVLMEPLPLLDGIGRLRDYMLSTLKDA
jgi:UDP-glucose 4-epimerase